MQLRAGEPETVELWIRHWEAPLFRVAYRILGNIEDAEEARQNVFLKLLRNLDRLPEPERHDAWIRRCAINESISIYRRNQRFSKSLKEIGDAQRSGQAATANSAASNTGLDLDLKTVLSELDGEDRALLSLRFDEGLTLREIGKALETPHTTVQARLEKLIVRVRKRLDPSVISRFKRGRQDDE